MRFLGIANAQPHNLLVQSIVDKALRRAATRYLHGTLVDLGCGTLPYREMILPLVTNYIGVDHTAPPGVDTPFVRASAYALPIRSGCADSVLSSAVLEHLEDPDAALAECFRIMTPGACLVLTVPFIWHLHEEPRDFFRYSKYGLAHVLSKAGFQIESIEALSGFWVTFGQLLAYNLHRFNRGWLKWTGLVSAATLLVQGVAWGLEKFDRNEKWTWMYLAVARKPVPEVKGADSALRGCAQ